MSSKSAHAFAVLRIALSATQTANGVAIAPSGQTAYVLSSCVDTACEGQVARYTIGTNGTLTATGSTTLTGDHVIPIAMVVDTSGSSAYLLTDLMGVDTNTGAVYGYVAESKHELGWQRENGFGAPSGGVSG